MIKYCKRCIMPETTPDLYIGRKWVYSARRYIERRVEVGWGKRKHHLIDILHNLVAEYIEEDNQFPAYGTKLEYQHYNRLNNIHK